MSIVRTIADRVGLDPWDVNPKHVKAFLTTHEHEPQSRFRLGSPCRFIRKLDVAVHVILPAMLEERWSTAANYLRRTSPRWGKAWRNWSHF